MAQASVPGWAGHQEAPASVATVSSSTKKTASTTSTATRCRRYQATGGLRSAHAAHAYVISPRRPGPGRETFGGAGTYESRMPAAAGQPFVGPEPDRLPCRRAAPAALQWVTCKPHQHSPRRHPGSAGTTSTRPARPSGSGPGTCSGSPRCAAASRSGAGRSTSPSRWPSRESTRRSTRRASAPATRPRDASVRSARFLDAEPVPGHGLRVGTTWTARISPGTLTVRAVTRPVRLPVRAVRRVAAVVHRPGHRAHRPDRVRRDRFPRAGRAATSTCPWRSSAYATERRDTRSSRCHARSGAVIVAGLRKSYGAVQAVRDVSFTVRPGEIFALLGPNGAGKTTTLEILEGFRARDGGRPRCSASTRATGPAAARCASGSGWCCRTSRSSRT